LIELSLRNRIATVKDPRQFSISDRIVQVTDESTTGEVLLDETLRFLKSDNDSVTNWIDLLSGNFVS
jgi:golgi phosphoprotein 3